MKADVGLNTPLLRPEPESQSACQGDPSAEDNPHEPVMDLGQGAPWMQS